MPCRSEMDDNPHLYYGQQAKEHEAEIKRLQRKLSFAESALCGLMRAGTLLTVARGYGNMLDLVQFEDVGIKRDELEKWFINHEEVDKKVLAEKARRAKAAAELKAHLAEQKKKRDAAIAKLSPEEIKLLGVK